MTSRGALPHREGRHSIFRARWIIGASVLLLLADSDCAGPNRIYPKRDSPLVGPCCTSFVASQRQKVAVTLRSGERIEGELVAVECEPETTIVLDFSNKRGMFRIAGEPDSARIPLAQVRSINSLVPATNVIGIGMAILFVGCVILIVTMAPLMGAGWSG